MIYCVSMSILKKKHFKECTIMQVNFLTNVCHCYGHSITYTRIRIYENFPAISFMLSECPVCLAIWMGYHLVFSDFHM